MEADSAVKLNRLVSKKRKLKINLRKSSIEEYIVEGQETHTVKLNEKELQEVKELSIWDQPLQRVVGRKGRLSQVK